MGGSEQFVDLAAPLIYARSVQFSPQESVTAPQRVRRRSSRAWSVLIFAGSLSALNALITAYKWVPAGRLVFALLPAVETAATVLIAVALAHLRKPGRRVISILWSGALGLCVVFSAAEGFYQRFFQRHFTPWTDLPFVKGGLLLLFGPMDRLLVPATVITFVLILGVAIASSWFCLRGLARACRDVISMRTASILALAILAVAVLSTRPAEWLTVTLARSIGRPAVAALTGLHEVEEAPIELVDSSLVKGFPGFAGGDVHLFFVESYGRAAFSRPELFRELEPLLGDLERKLNQAGYDVVSGFLSSPVTGGYSWIAEAAFLTGAPIFNQTDYAAAIETGIATLPHIMAKNGYITLLSMPGTVHGEWPEARSFYHFEEVMLASEFDYVGPYFSFAPIPDQVGIAQAYRRLTEARTDGLARPAYIQHVLVSSHAPYNRIPPYIPNWKQLGDGSLYNDLPIKTFDNDWFGGRQYDEGYISALSYSLTTIGAFLTQIVKEDVVAVLIGDHQPGRPVGLPGAPMSVPIHIVAREAHVISAFADHGYVAGMIPTQAQPHEPTYTFLDLFLQIARELPPNDESETAPQ